MGDIHLNVCIRCRPFAHKDSLGVLMTQEEDGNSSVELLDEHGNSRSRTGFSKAWWSGSGYERFTDDRSQAIIRRHKMTHSITQEEIYAQVGENMKAQFLDGHAVVLFAYGLSGLGKTFSVFGPDMVGMPEAWFNYAEPHPLWGVFPRLAYDIMTKESVKRGGQWNMSMKYFQNVIDRIRDLLSGEFSVSADDDSESKEQEHSAAASLRRRRRSMAPGSSDQRHSSSSSASRQSSSEVEDRHINDGFHQDAHGFVDITWCRKKKVETWNELIAVFKIANGKKAIAPTQYNPASTRGHCILVFEADMPHPTKRGVRRAGRLYVCDLAGAEPAATVYCAKYDRIVAKDGSIEYIERGKDSKQSKTDELVAQGKKINLSLSEMTGFFRQMAKLIKAKKFNSSRPIPGCRTYFLGKFLKNTLMHAQTYLFAGIRPEHRYQTFTEATLHFAENASVVKLQPKRMDSHLHADHDEMGGADQHGLYAHEITLQALQEKLRVMHDVVSGRRVLSFQSQATLSALIESLPAVVVSEQMKQRLTDMNEKGDTCAAAMLATIRLVLMGKDESEHGARGGVVEDGGGVDEEEKEAVEKEAVEKEEINVEAYGREKTKELMEDRMELEERAMKIQEMENMEHDENGRSHSGSHLQQNDAVSVEQHKCENML